MKIIQTTKCLSIIMSKLFFNLFTIILWFTYLFSTENLKVHNLKQLTELYKPLIIESPKDSITTDNILEFVCKAEGNPNPIINWYNASTKELIEENRQVSGTKTNIHVNSYFGRLIIINPIPKMIYLLYCNASNSVGWTITEPSVRGFQAFLNTEFAKSPQSQTAIEGSSITIECEPPDGLPKPNVYWIKDDHVINSDENVTQSHDITLANVRLKSTGDLRIHPTSLKDSGNYLCVAHNLAGQKNSSVARIQIKPRSSVYKIARHVRVRLNDQVKLVCPFNEGMPVSWKRKSGLHLDPQRTDQNDGYLLINQARQSDSDMYICKIANYDEFEIRLSVETPPSFIRAPKDQILSVGEKAIFFCIADGNPKPAIYWELPDKIPIFPTDELDQIKKHTHYRVHIDGRLEINNVTAKDAGKYQCIAHSSIDTVHTSAVLKVIKQKSKISKPSLSTHIVSDKISKPFEINHDYISPYIGLPPGNVTKLFRDSVVLNCELPSYELNEKVHFNINISQWMVDWKRVIFTHQRKEILQNHLFSINNEKFQKVFGNSLQIQDLQIDDSGTYTCTVQDISNPMSIPYNWTVLLTVVEKIKLNEFRYFDEYPLSPPLNLHLLNSTNQSITLGWDSPSILQTFYPKSHPESLLTRSINYWIELYSPMQINDGWLTIERSWPINVITLNGIEPHYPYYVIVRARREQGRLGWASNLLGPLFGYSQKSQHQFKPSFEKIEIKIKNIQITSVDSKTLHISWSLIEMPELLKSILGFVVYYRTVEHVECFTNSSGKVMSTNFDLTENYCSLGKEKYFKENKNTEIYKRLELIKQMHNEEKYEQTLNNSLSTYPGVLSTLVVESKHIHSIINNHNNKIHPINHQINALLTDLKPFRCYEIGIKPFTQKIYIHHLETKNLFTHTILTFESSPGSAPQNIYGRWLINKNLELGWTAPPISDWNGLIIGYIIYVQDEFLKSFENMNITAQSRKTVINLNKLPEIFSIQIAAYTCYGIGIRSEKFTIGQNKNSGIFFQNYIHNLETTETIQTKFIQTENLFYKPWFIGLIVGSLIIWLIILGVCIYCWLGRNKLCKNRATYRMTSNNCGELKSNLNITENNENLKYSKQIPTSYNEKNQLVYTEQNLVNQLITSQSVRSQEKNPNLLTNHRNYLVNKQHSETNSNGSSGSYGLQYLGYSDESRHGGIINNSNITNNNSSSNVNNNNKIPVDSFHSVGMSVPHIFYSKQSATNSGSVLFSSDRENCTKHNSSQFTSPSQTSSEPFDSAIYLEQIPNKTLFNESSVSVLTPPRLIGTIPNECNQIYSPVTPYASASIIENQKSEIDNNTNNNTDCNNYKLNTQLKSFDETMDFCHQTNMYITLTNYSQPTDLLHNKTAPYL